MTARGRTPTQRGGPRGKVVDMEFSRGSATYPKCHDPRRVLLPKGRPERAQERIWEVGRPRTSATSRVV